MEAAQVKIVSIWPTQFNSAQISPSRYPRCSLQRQGASHIYLAATPRAFQGYIGTVTSNHTN